MRTPVLIHTREDRDSASALSDALAELLVAEYRRRHSQDNQQALAATVASPRGINHLDNAPQAEHYVAISCGNDGQREGSNGGAPR